MGIPLPGVEVRLAAVPEMGYDPMADPPRGEVLLKGPNVFQGYYKQEDKTKEVLSADGWFYTGESSLPGWAALQIGVECRDV